MPDSPENIQVTEPLPEWVERVIDRALYKHQSLCPVIVKVNKLELRFAALVGYMLGSGLVGGAAGAALMARILGN
ncbi:MAG: hypothetical protein JXQ75_03150 [Phycisphaerae bacterium]|nr:hypothetical protein [Phycisphaerae bacterium]